MKFLMKLLLVVALSLYLASCASSDDTRRLNQQVVDLEARVKAVEAANANLDAMNKDMSARIARQAAVLSELSPTITCFRDWARASTSGNTVVIHNATITRETEIAGLFEITGFESGATSPPCN